MTRLTHTLAALYTLAALALIAAAKTSHDHGHTGWGLLYLTCAVLYAAAVFHHGYHRDELRAVRRQLERAARPPEPYRSRIDDAVAIALADACCELWWTSAGTDHDPATCTRKDQTT